jgi:hypothetical protein
MKIEAAVLPPGLPGFYLLNASPKRTLAVVGPPSGTSPGLGGSVIPAAKYMEREGIQVDSAEIEGHTVVFRRGDRVWMYPLDNVVLLGSAPKVEIKK